MSVKCVFDAKRECPVRKEIKQSLEAERGLDRIIKPLGDKEVLKMFIPILDKMKTTLHSEFGLLHNYCKVCRATVPCP